MEARCSTIEIPMPGTALEGALEHKGNGLTSGRARDDGELPLKRPRHGAGVRGAELAQEGGLSCGTLAHNMKLSNKTLLSENLSAERDRLLPQDRTAARSLYIATEAHAQRREAAPPSSFCWRGTLNSQELAAPMSAARRRLLALAGPEATIIADRVRAVSLYVSL